MDILLSILIGICLSAASGFRIFVPFFVLSMASFIGGIDFGVSASWLNSVNILIGFSIASALEIAGYFNTWIDNMLDLISTPLSFLAGIILLRSFLPDINPFLKWAMLLICGGGVALNVRLLSLKARALSSFFKSGHGNRIITTIETFSSFIISFLAIYNPFAAVLVALFVIFSFLKINKIVKVKAKA